MTGVRRKTAKSKHRRDVLSQAHRRELEQASAIDPSVIAERGYRTLKSREEVAALGFSVARSAGLPGLFLPMFRATGERIAGQFKPASAVAINGRSVKYLSLRGQPNCLDVHPRNRASITDVDTTLWITEGLKKGDSLTSRGCCVVTLTGVFNWRSKLATLGDWEDVPLKGRIVVICFDADARTNMNVARAMVRLGRWFKSKGVKRVQYLIVPSEVQGTQTKGVDDYFAAGGTLEMLEAGLTTTEPDAEAADDTFSDSRLAETIADEVFTDRFLWCKALGWFGWNRQRWTPVTEEKVGEVVRRFALKRFTAAVKIGKKPVIEGWHSMLTARRQRAVLSLTKGIVERQADAFDTDPDLLNTQSGVVDLKTGVVLPHDPELLMTKITRGAYRPGHTHPDWTQALTAIRAADRSWFQVRVGQALTGHPTPDGVILILQGGGENGKSAITTDGILPALGDYAAPASSKLITSAKDEHSTERADLRGQRFLIAEELTEDRALNITAIKQTTDVSVIKARHVHKDNMTFAASHSLVLTSNYKPVVNETDHGTWRRLVLVVLPWTYRKPDESLAGPTERRGDPGLKARLRAGADGQHDAAVTWAVEGARRWNADGFPAVPAAVQADTRAWRKESDRIFAFWDDMLVADRESCITTGELVSAFNEWLATSGQREWNRELFHSRFKGHGKTVQHHVVERRTTKRETLDKLSWRSCLPQQAPNRAYVYLGVRFRAAEIGEIAEQNCELPALPDLSATLPRTGDHREYPNGAGSVGSDCCEVESSAPLADSTNRDGTTAEMADESDAEISLTFREF